MIKPELHVEQRNGVLYKYSPEWTRRLESLRHWEFYWHQQKLMEDYAQRHTGETILEIGVGSGFAANYCRSLGFNVTTLDIDAEKKPDIVANVVDYDFKEKYDHVMAFEILEHIPYKEFEIIIHKIPSFTNKYAFISLPQNGLSLLSLSLKLPKLPFLKWNVRVPEHQIGTESHHWELDHQDTTTKRVETLFQSAGLKVVKSMKHEYKQFWALSVI